MTGLQADADRGIRDERTVPGRVVNLGWLSLCANVLIVGTGGAVRLTASGLGCPTWPLCTEDSLVNIPEMGIHGFIEFGNRMLTFVLVAVALACFIAVKRHVPHRRDLVGLSLTVGIGIIVQAVVGGVTVLLNLHPGAVGIHYMLSAVVVAVAATFVYRARTGIRPVGEARGLRRGVGALAVVSVVAIYVGTLTTGAGPHAGDSAAERNGLDPALMQQLHAWPGYAMFALTLVLLIATRLRRQDEVRRLLWLLLALEVLQIAIGIVQARLGLPVVLVGAHMVLACVIVAVLAWVWHAARTATTPSDHR